MTRRYGSGRGRYYLLDGIRGITLISMILYHAAWDLVYLLGVEWSWYHSDRAFVWQQSICWTFILLSGFCMTLSRHKWRRGLVVSGAGLLVTAATLVFLPQDRVVFGVLTFLGSAMLVTALLEQWLLRVQPVAGMVICSVLFYVFRWVNHGYLQLWQGKSVSLPSAWYQGGLGAFAGFPGSDFFSTDYFSFLPWIFLFWVGMYLGCITERLGDWKRGILGINAAPLTWMGQHSLLIYLLHQPVLYTAVVLMKTYLPGLL